jgi:hypothetical protein
MGSEGEDCRATDSDDPVPSRALIYLVSAALVSRSFRALLLTDPVRAIAAGYRGKPFALTQEEEARLAEMRAMSLTSLAAELLRSFSRYDGDG